METSTSFNHTIRLNEFIKSGNHCCSKDCIRNFYKLQPEELYRFGEDLAQCSKDAKEAALLMNLREHHSRFKFFFKKLKPRIQL